MSNAWKYPPRPARKTWAFPVIPLLVGIWIALICAVFVFIA
jgi:hypothetical protein